ncbi:photoreceptor cilium actin regulator [Gymnogyps californianus]|uniref:photoreceptor cilium actin regulator n=1 Tax=Gymnogyps californianus TaxID=33616 RepID=UPI0021C611E1|nr:photoreceptor cilium actin regulator [Gymnogyps californianus]
MGCTPSHSEIANTIARSGLKALTKPKGILRIDPGEKGIPLLVKGSSCYSIDEFHQYEIQRKDYLREKEDKLPEQDKNDNLQLFSNAHSDPQISREYNKIERTATDAEVIMSELIQSQKHITEAIQIRKQSSCESEASAFIWDDKNESNAKQIPKKGKKQKNHKLAKQSRPSKIKEKSSLAPYETEKKVDFPELLVKAHQSAYAYLNPNLSKYETILHMATQATQTQLFLQQMVSFLVLRFDEINQLLEEIASDGENLLKDVGGNLAWPAEKGDLKEHPDLLQQLLQYTVNKMQLLSGTLASITSDALQETCSYLQSAASNLEGKLKAKQSFDERLLWTVRLLEASTVGSSQSHGDDRTLYSEDSGIGVDNESLKEFSALSQHGGQASCDSCAHGHLSQKHARTVEHVRDGTVSPGTAASHDCALERHFRDVFYSSVQSRKATSCQGGVPEGISPMPQYASLSKSRSYNSFQCDSTQEGEPFKICESTDFPSDDDDDDEGSTLGEDDDNTSLSEMGKDTLPRRSLSSPAVTDNTQRQSIKRTENAETEEIILKMKDAISEKIKFVPAKSGRKEWIEDESGRAVLKTRPSTATGSQKTFGKQRRSRSEESLRSQAEDPTLLELQRTQKELSKRLEMFYGKKDTDNNAEPWKSRTAPYLQDEQITSRSSSKLKACLSKNFSILPNQDKVPLFMVDQNPPHQLDEKRGRKPLRVIVPAQETPGGKGKEPPGAQTLSGSSFAPRQSVKKLIETFSPTDDLVKAAPLRSLGPIKCIRKFGLPVIPPTIPFQSGLAPLNLKHRISPVEDTNPSNTNGVSSSFPNAFPSAPAAELSKKDTKEETDEDIENLPPPPPEMLIDTSFDLSEPEETARIEGNSSEDAKKPTKTEFHATKRSQVSPKMKASLQSIDLLPSKNISGPSAITNKGLRNTGAGDEKLQRYSLELNPTNVHIPSQEEILATQRKEAADLYKQTHKIIPLHNPSGVSKPQSNSSESKDPNSPATSVQYQKHSSPDSLRRNEKGSAFARRVSPTRTPPSSPPTEKRLFSPPTHHRHSLQAFSNPQLSSPTMQRKPSPPSSPRVPSPPLQKKLPSPPPQRKPLSPSAGHKQSSPTSYRLLGSPAYRRDASPPPFPTAPSPPTSPSRSYKGPRAGLDAGDEHQLSSSKRGSNVRSIFCPATSSLFEARPPLVLTKPAAEVTSQPEASLLSQKSSLLFRQPGDQTRKLSLSAANPQPFVRRSFSDRRPGVQFHLPAPVTAGSEPALNQASLEESPRKAGDSWNSPCVPEIKESNRSASHPELYVVGQGLQRD